MDGYIYINMGIIHTLQETMAHSKTMTYMVMILVLFSIAGFWTFLSDRGESPDEEEGHDHH